jgi:glyoxylase-like metal-dependent hydrolase (beta-lactamase superfamily II)
MLKRWTRKLVWRPYEVLCRAYPLVPFRSTITEPVEGVLCIRIDNAVTHFLSRFSGGYDYAVCYLIDGTVLVDTGFGWARRRLERTLRELGADRTITTVVNTHYHEDHTGNNDLLAEITSARIVAHPVAIPEIRFPPRLAWYRSFLFGPTRTVDVSPIGERIEAGRFELEVHHMPGHCPGHICLFEPTRRLLFSGDLYVAADLDSQLSDADGPEWIASLERAIALEPAALFDAHGTILTDAHAVDALLRRKLAFLISIRERVHAAATEPQTIEQLTRKVFDRNDLVDHLSLNDGWMSLITGSDFSRGNLVRSFLREKKFEEFSHVEDVAGIRFNGQQ